MRNHYGKIAFTCAASITFIFVSTVTIKATNVEYLHAVNTSFYLVLIRSYFLKKRHDNYSRNRFMIINDNLQQIEPLIAEIVFQQ